MPRYLLAFESTHAAMAANKALAAVKPAMIPTPRAITANCGMTLRFEAPNAAKARALAASVTETRGLATLYADEMGEYILIERL